MRWRARGSGRRGIRNPQAGDDEIDHAPGVEAGVVFGAGAQTPNAIHQAEGICARLYLSRSRSRIEQFRTDWNQAVEEPGMQRLVGCIIGLQRGGEAVLGDQEIDEQVNPA